MGELELQLNEVLGQSHTKVFLVSVLLLAAIVLLIVSAHYLRKAVDERRLRRVRSQSKYYRGLVELRNQYEYRFRWDVNPLIKFIACGSKAQFDLFDRTKRWQAVVEFAGTHEREIRDAAEKVRINRIIDCEYAEKIEALPLRSFSGKLGDLESSLCREQELRPMTELALHLEISYTSPAGRNHYHRRFVYGQDKLFTAIEQSHRTVTEQERRRQERAKITPKLRHQILERDHYRCVHCGASAVEGAKLHVDHIVPISQGGKTEMGNLQTLCEQCNLGKGNSMPRC